jgi:hypothetical protein
VLSWLKSVAMSYSELLRMYFFPWNSLLPVWLACMVQPHYQMTGPQCRGNMCRALHMFKRKVVSHHVATDQASVLRQKELSYKEREARCLIPLHAPASTVSLSPSGSVAFPKVSGAHRDNWSYPWHKCLTLPTRV